MSTTITLPDHIARQLEQHAVAQHRTPESLAIELIALGLADTRPETDTDADLLALVARIKAMPRDPDNIVPAQGNLADVLRSLEAQEYESDPEAEYAALRAADAELRAINQADDLAEGRG